MEADVYRLAGDAKLPAVLLLHGGGVRDGGTRTQMNGIARKLVKRGYVVVNATYRSIPEYRYPAPFDDLREALKWMRVDSERYGIDPDRIATFGYSAGGYLAALVALKNPPQEDRVRAIVSGGSPFDLAFYRGGNLIPTYLGGTQAEVPWLFYDASPVNHVRRDSPPIFIFHGAKDSIVPPAHAVRMRQEYLRKGAKSELHWREHGHVNTFLFPGPVIDQAIDFLDREMK